MCQMIENIIFDLDGTLVDSSTDIITCLRKTYDLLEVRPKNRITTSLIGPPLKEMMRAISPDLDDDTINRLVSTFREIYDNCGFSGSTLLDSVRPFLEDCRRKNIRLFIATNKPESPSIKLINLLNINFFLDLATIDNISGFPHNKVGMLLHLIKQWNMKKELTLMVGDSVSDVVSAKKVGIKSIAFLNGYGDSQEITKYKPEHCIHKIDELNDLFCL